MINLGNGLLYSKELIKAGTTTQVVHFCGEEFIVYEAVQDAKNSCGTMYGGDVVIANITETSYGEVNCSIMQVNCNALLAW